ncbi:MAG: carboxylesterase family protein [Clostridia bacterium]|nr:carboxylesterase family protein [Clostridia bacterium]
MLRQVKVETGTLRGTPAADPRITAFRGVPFAAPPVGALRWKAPRPAEPWEGVLEALEFAPIAMQRIPGLAKDDIYTREWNVDPEIPMDEDCLYLNVWTPAKEPGEKLPVFVWYYGGGLQVGNPAEMEFNGERIARRGIVVVTVNYRVNVFGFLAHPALTAEDPAFAANFGNLDQKAGTEWVRRNIAAFGGDPSNITIGGQSAGGGSVLTQLASPLTEGLFQKAIVQSGILLGGYADRTPLRRQALADAEQDGEAFFRFLGVNTLEEARAIDACTLRDKALEYKGFWGTVVDGNYLPAGAMERIMRNERHRVPLLMGNTSSEFKAVPEADSFEAFERLAREKFGDRAEEFLRIVRADTLERTIANATYSPIELGVRAAYARTAEKPGAPDNFYYVFDADIPGWDHPGTFHSVDLWFFFETLAACWRPFTGRHYDLARHMCNYWANFIRSGDPNGPDADGTPMPAWRPYTDGDGPMVFRDVPAMAEPGSASPLMRFLVDFQLGAHPV